MTKRIIAICALLICSMYAIGQTASIDKFFKFAQRQDSQFVKAYESKDVTLYDKLLTEFLDKYNKLDPDDRKRAKMFLNGAYYNFACTYSLLNNRAKALEYLEKSVDEGYYDYNHVQEDNDLDNIRKEDKFAQITTRMRDIGDYVYILKKAKNYNNADARETPVFTYQPGSNPNLAALRQGMRLDSVAGTGNEISKMLNLLHYIHNMIPHDGNHDNPETKNAMAMIEVCKKSDRGLNCRGLATVLNECYLAMGFKSRFVTCLPKDSLGIDPDCHVINMVYSDSLKKWLWIDPTNDAYVMDENGVMLSIEEVRWRLVNDKPLVVNSDANWNHKKKVVKEDYLYSYMAKNLYMLQCNVSSEYNAETREKGKTFSSITLIPLDYFKQSPDKTLNSSKDKTTISVTYKTNNPVKFWAAPY